MYSVGIGEEWHAWYDMAFMGTGKRISQAKKNLCNNDADVFWQKKARVDKFVMRDLVETFVEN